jgi:signal transduction histidine kinase
MGRLHVTSSAKEADLDDLDQQVIAITHRMDSVLQQLQSARVEILRGERLAAVGQLAAGIAHEIRNPLTSVKLLVQIVAREQPRDSESAKQLQVVLDEIARMERTIQSLLDFARPPTQNRTRHDLRETLGRAINLVQGRASRDRVVIEADFANESLDINADGDQLRQVFVNLFFNCMEAMPDGGHSRVALSRECAVSKHGNDSQTWCVARICDDGIGIPATVMNHLFEPFVTTKERGTGLGLAISRRIIEEHGGTLTAANRSNGGAEFTVRLPSAVQLESPVD